MEAEAEGLRLHLSSSSKTGYTSVYRKPLNYKYKPYEVKAPRHNAPKSHTLNSFTLLCRIANAFEIGRSCDARLSLLPYFVENNEQKRKTPASLLLGRSCSNGLHFWNFSYCGKSENISFMKCSKSCVCFSVSCFRFPPKHRSTETMQLCKRDSAALQWRLWHFPTVLANSRLSVGAPCAQKAGTDRERTIAYHVPRNVSDSSDNQRMGKILRSIYRHVILHQFYTKFAKFVN